jgi:hypothetical protein
MRTELRDGGTSHEWVCDRRDTTKSLSAVSGSGTSHWCASAHESLRIVMATTSGNYRQHPHTKAVPPMPTAVPKPGTRRMLKRRRDQTPKDCSTTDARLAGRNGHRHWSQPNSAHRDVNSLAVIHANRHVLVRYRMVVTISLTRDPHNPQCRCHSRPYFQGWIRARHFLSPRRTADVADARATRSFSASAHLIRICSPDGGIRRTR